MGVVACITSYNFPMVNMAGKVAPALAAGNTVVVKPAPQDPLAIVEFVRILDEVGFPPGVVNLVNGSGPEAAAASVDSPDVDMVSFTGSTEVGTRIAGRRRRTTMKRLLLELGGKGACVVFDDADVKAAIAASAPRGRSTPGRSARRPPGAWCTAAFRRTSATAWPDGGIPLGGGPHRQITIIGPVISAAQPAGSRRTSPPATDDGRGRHRGERPAG